MLLLPQTSPAGDQFDDLVEAIQVFNAVQVGVGGTCQADDLEIPDKYFPTAITNISIPASFSRNAL